ncbi:MAG: hypothetical protein IPK32_26675 [Verrucomicrobiaceae bacterium]|nr:hypothetical protein [Verrucomicrobiaceae bacterium]
MSCCAFGEKPDVILDDIAVDNLQLEYAEAEETTFEETIFALGHLEVLPGKKPSSAAASPDVRFPCSSFRIRRSMSVPKSPGSKAASPVIHRR